MDARLPFDPTMPLCPALPSQSATNHFRHHVIDKKSDFIYRPQALSYSLCYLAQRTSIYALEAWACPEVFHDTYGWLSYSKAFAFAAHLCHLTAVRKIGQSIRRFRFNDNIQSSCLIMLFRACNVFITKSGARELRARIMRNYFSNMLLKPSF